MPTIEQQPTRAGFRERLLDGLAASIREKGLQGTQISDIVRHARTSRRTFYECFADKESCFVELLEASNLAIVEAVRTAVDPTAPWAEQVDQAIDSYLEALGSDPALTVTISRELPTLGTRGADLLHASIDRYAQLVLALAESSRPRRGARAKVSLEEAVMLAGGVAEIVGRALLRGEDVRTAAPVIKAVFKAVLDPRRVR